ncbi:hypothetical protein [Nostoc sp. 106C]|uniref:hypothetical protein n=1 Tax=Nostoc sp. 106C TaxID=1932667 RepID=UPI000A37EAA4|nr:hypothetical protein [Nostoc sp. 106C]OUL28295.1 hypothetical protein BV378_07685 [Nostoc sp. RF31YmG]OUL34085.1 hypothetical protein BV375_05245 [Nostoc sp. 106C]
MNNHIYQASLTVLTENGVPEELAKTASAIVASDDPSLPSLGRTVEDQQAIAEVVAHLNKGDEE